MRLNQSWIAGMRYRRELSCQIACRCVGAT